MNLPKEIAHYIKKMPSGCWEWQRAATKMGGYGLIGVPKLQGGRTTALVHRIAYLWANGPIRPDEIVMHTCDNPPCGRPDHLVVGSYKDNVQDMLAKGRTNNPNGERHAQAKLSDKDVRRIRKLIGTVPAVDLAHRYGVNPSTIANIKAGRKWAHIV